MKSRLAWCCAIMAAATGLEAATFYADPVDGSMDNDGSAAHPWASLSDVVAAGKIESRQPVSFPYDGTGELKPKNSGAPVKAGDTILCLNGYHGAPYLEKYYNEGMITIAAAPGHQPTFRNIHLRSCSNWTLRGLTVSPSFASTYVRKTLIDIESHGWSGPSSYVNVENCTVYSEWDTSAWTLDDWLNRACSGIAPASRCHLRGNYIRNVQFGIPNVGYRGIAETNIIENFSGDGMRANGNYCILRGNLIKNCYDVDENHDDGIQAWTSLDGVVGAGILKGVLIEGNTIINYEDPDQPFRGPLQGIGCFDGLYQDWIVRDNMIIVDQWNGIVLYGATNCLVEHNTLFDPDPDKPGPSWLQINRDKDGIPSAGTIVRDNLVTALSIPSGQNVQSINNLVFSDPDTFFIDPARFIMRLKPGCPACNAATDGTHIGARHYVPYGTGGAPPSAPSNVRRGP